MLYGIGISGRSASEIQTILQPFIQEIKILVAVQTNGKDISRGASHIFVQGIQSRCRIVQL